MVKQLNEQEKVTILQMQDRKVSIQKISKKIKRNWNTVKNFLQKWTNTKSFAWNKGSGHPPKLSKRDKNMIIRESIKNRFDSSKKIKENLDVNVTCRTVRNVLISRGLRARKPVKKPY